VPSFVKCEKLRLVDYMRVFVVLHTKDFITSCRYLSTASAAIQQRNANNKLLITVCV